MGSAREFIEDLSEEITTGEEPLLIYGPRGPLNILSIYKDEEGNIVIDVATDEEVETFQKEYIAWPRL